MAHLENVSMFLLTSCAGNIGVVITLGHVASYPPGIHWRIPYASHLVLLSAKTQKLDEQNQVPTKEGLSVQLDTAV